MAANAAVMQNLQQNISISKEQLDLPTNFISGTPSLDWAGQKLILDNKLAEKRMSNLDCKSVAQGVAPGGRNAGGAAVAGPVQAVFNSASQSVYGLLMGKTKSGTIVGKLPVILKWGLVITGNYR